jgi:hypothetical protein
MDRLAVEPGIVLELNRKFSRADCREKEHPGRRIPSDFVYEGFSRRDDFRGRPQIVCRSRAKS